MYIAIRCQSCNHGIGGTQAEVERRRASHESEHVENGDGIPIWQPDLDAMGSDRGGYYKAGWYAFREDVRGAMRAGGVTDNAVVSDLIREVAEWHDAGRPDVEETIRRVKSESGRTREEAVDD